MTQTRPETDDLLESLLETLSVHRSAVLWKTEGLSEWDLRRPLTPTGTSILGLVKHLATMESQYFGACLGRDHVAIPWAGELDSAEPSRLGTSVDLVALPSESSEMLIDLYRRAGEATDAALRDVGLAAEARVPWWGASGRAVTTAHLLAFVTAETARHAGHLDILREMIDGASGWSPDAPVMQLSAPEDRRRHHAQAEAYAREARDGQTDAWAQPSLRSERLVLTPTTAEDFEGVRRMHGDPHSALMMHNPVWTEENAQRLFAQKLAEAGRRHKQSWTVRTQEGEFVGRVILTLEEHRQAVLGWSVVPEARGKGYAAEAVAEVIALAERDHEVHRVTAVIDAENTASKRVAEKCGLTRTAVHEDSRLVNGRWRSHEVWAAILS